MKTGLLLIAIAFSSIAAAQITFSVVTGGAVLRNFSPQQKFWAVGQTVRMDLHFTPKQSAYASIDYYTDGSFKNNFTATAKSNLITPQRVNYRANGVLTFRQLSLGWKHYFKGGYTAGKSINLYGAAGFGFLFAKVRNGFSMPVDESLYSTQTKEGQGRIKKLTLDLALGGELPLGGNFFAFADARTWLPASGNTSPLLHNQRNLPLTVTASIGLRLLFDFVY
ncbi:MAG TPA: hypothetical protein VM884_05200 [Flavisolibacter sp.]|nr:hypothetical protein [Flavisolibacter sp.]